MTVFADPLELTIADPDHSEAEQRFLSIGQSKTGRLLVVAYTERAGRTRIINAREASSQERKHYESRNPAEGWRRDAARVRFFARRAWEALQGLSSRHQRRVSRTRYRG